MTKLQTCVCICSLCSTHHGQNGNLKLSINIRQHSKKLKRFSVYLHQIWQEASLVKKIGKSCLWAHSVKQDGRHDCFWILFCPLIFCWSATKCPCLFSAIKAVFRLRKITETNRVQLTNFSTLSTYLIWNISPKTTLTFMNFENSHHFQPQLTC